MSDLLLSPQHLTQCLTHDRHSANMCYMNNNSEKIIKLKYVHPWLLKGRFLQKQRVYHLGVYYKCRISAIQ